MPAHRRSGARPYPRLLTLIAALLLTSAGLVLPPEPVTTAQDSPPNPLVHLPTLVRVDLPALPDGQFTSVIAGGPGFIAVGYTYDGAPLIYVTDDLVDWVPVALTGQAANGQIRDIVAYGGGFAAVGGSCCPDTAAVWLSADGLTWRRIATTTPLKSALMLAVTTWQGDLHAVGCSAEMECFSGLHWVSTDGRTWSAAALPNDAGWLYDDIAADSASRLLVVGRETATSGAGVTAATADGETWTTAIIRGHVELTAARVVPWGFVACGRSLGVDGVSSARLLRSRDGTTWQDSPITSPPDATFTDLQYSGGILVSGWQALPSGETRAGAWVSVVGETWRRIAFAESDGTVGRALGRVNALAAGTNALDVVAVGAVTGPDGADTPAIWVQW